MCITCNKRANNKKKMGKTCKYPNCTDICKGDSYGNFCSSKCKRKNSADQKAAKKAALAIRSPSQTCNHTSGCTNKVVARGLCRKHNDEKKAQEKAQAKKTEE